MLTLSLAMISLVYPVEEPIFTPNSDLSREIVWATPSVFEVLAIKENSLLTWLLTLDHSGVCWQDVQSG